MEYTKGKWRVIETVGTLEPKGAVVWADGYGEIVHMVSLQDNYLANAHLIAAAPAMYEALKDIKGRQELALGGWLSVTETYLPEWAQPIRCTLEIIDKALALAERRE